MAHVTDFLLMFIVLLGLAALGSNRIAGCIRAVAAQGVLLSVLFIVVHVDEITPRLLMLASAMILLKGFVMPWLLLRSVRAANTELEVEPYVSFTLSVVLGAVGLGAAFGLSNLLPPFGEVTSKLIVPVSLATVFIGLLLLVSRKKAVTQVLGYLVLENGIFVFSLSLAAELPTLVEMGVLLDVFVAVFVMGITIYQIDREFDHIDASKLRELHDDVGRRRRWPFALNDDSASEEEGE